MPERTILYLRPLGGLPAAEFADPRALRGVRLVEAPHDDAAAIGAALAECDAVILQDAAPPADAFRRAPRCGIVVNASGGGGGLSMEILRELGIFVASVPESGAKELGRGSVYAAARLIAKSPHPAFRKIRFGLMGLGAVGQAAAARAAELGWRVSAYDPFADGELFRRAGVRRAPDAPSIFGDSDAVALALPLVPDTRRLIGASLLSLAPRGAALVNLSEAGLVDESALCASLDSGRHSGAAVANANQADPRVRALLDQGRLVVNRFNPREDPEVRLGALRRALEIALAAFDGVVPPHLLIDPPMPRLLTRPAA